MNDLENEILKDMASFAHNPLGFVRYAFDWGEGQLKGKEPDQWQIEVLTEIGDKLKSGEAGTQEAIQIAVASGHGIGKSALVAWVILWAMCTHENTRGVCETFPNRYFRNSGSQSQS